MTLWMNEWACGSRGETASPLSRRTGLKFCYGGSFNVHKIFNGFFKAGGLCRIWEARAYGIH